MSEYFPYEIASGRGINISGRSIPAFYREPNFFIPAGTAPLPIIGQVITATGYCQERVVSGVTCSTDHIVIHSSPLSQMSLFTPIGGNKGSLQIVSKSSTTLTAIITKVTPSPGDIIGGVFVITDIAPPEGLLQTITVIPWVG